MNLLSSLESGNGDLEWIKFIFPGHSDILSKPTFGNIVTPARLHLPKQHHQLEAKSLNL